MRERESLVEKKVERKEKILKKKRREVSIIHTCSCHSSTLITGKKYDEIIDIEDEEFLDPEKAKLAKMQGDEENEDLESEQSLDDTSDTDEVSYITMGRGQSLQVYSEIIYD